MPELSVNIDHVATVRQARRATEPDPVWAAVQAELGGADGITIHLREDRRHIQDRDVRVLTETVASRINLELACWDEIIHLACEQAPAQATLVPEKREEVTTEGGLDVVRQGASLQEAIRKLQGAGILVSLFIDPEPDQIKASVDLGVEAIELHTGSYANARGSQQQTELEQLQQAGELAVKQGLLLHAGHGLTYHNVQPIAAIPNMRELNIGHSIVARALLSGMKEAVAEMKRIMLR